MVEANTKSAKNNNFKSIVAGKSRIQLDKLTRVQNAARYGFEHHHFAY